MNPNLIAALISAFSALVTVSGATYAAIRSGRDKKDRQADRTVAEETADKLEAEKGDIIDKTRSRLLQDINEQLKEAKREAEANRKEAERYRLEAYTLREELADEKSRSSAVIRRLTRRAETLEEWIDHNREQFGRLGIEGLPTDIIRDRRSHVTEEREQRERDDVS